MGVNEADLGSIVFAFVFFQWMPVHGDEGVLNI